ncbi:MAG TPA: dihydrofolate reductase family protein [Micromonosporaceae bacterium]
MSKIVVFENITLDGVIQAPARADEDTRGGFEHGGWALPYADPVTGAAAAQSIPGASALLLGRRTYEDFHAVWPNRTDNPFTEVLNKTQKYVTSRTLTEPLPWMNSTLLAGEAADTVSELKHGSDRTIVVLGSGELVATLARNHLIDEYVLLIHPLVLGSGRRLLDGRTELQLVESTTSSTGVFIATYRVA